MPLTSAAIEGFTKSILAYRYDDPKPIPEHHREMWGLCCCDHPQVAIAAPRGSAKSTAITFAYVLASVLFREHHHVLIISASEELASGFLNDIKVEIQENDLLCEAFEFKRFVKERETELIGEMKDGYRFRIVVKGAMQRMRGLKWERKRPSLVIPDDLEDEELVASDGRRDKFRRWFYGAVKPILRDGGKIRMVGTIMHMDSLLMRFMPPMKSAFTVDTPLKLYTEDDPDKVSVLRKQALPDDEPDRAWKSVLYRAHDKTFDHLLWPEMFPEGRLKKIRKDFAEQGMLDVYGQEYLNDPIDETTAYFRQEDFLPMAEKDFETHKVFYAAGDLAITENKRSAFTCLITGGVDSEGFLNIVDVRRQRIDSLEITSEMFSMQTRWDIDTFRLESENIAKSIGPFLYERMGKVVDGVLQPYINIDAKPPTKDKLARAQSIRAMMRAGRVRFNKQAAWYADLEEEMLHFPKWPYKDQVDTMAWLGLMVHEMAEGYTPQEEEDEAWNQEFGELVFEGANPTTGY